MGNKHGNSSRSFDLSTPFYNIIEVFRNKIIFGLILIKLFIFIGIHNFIKFKKKNRNKKKFKILLNYCIEFFVHI